MTITYSAFFVKNNQMLLSNISKKKSYIKKCSLSYKSDNEIF